MSPTPESNGLTKKSFCSALQCSVCPLFTRTWHFRGVSYVCRVCSAVVAEPLLPLVQSSAMALFACCRQGLVPVLLVGQLGTTLGLS